MKKSLSLVALFAVAAMFLMEAPAMSEAACNVTELSPCLPAIGKGEPASAVCCSRLQAQKPCFCQYLKDPNLRKYVDSPNARKVAAACHVAYPKC